MSKASELKDALFLEKKHGGLILSEEELKKAQDFCEEYKNFLNQSKTEREAVDSGAIAPSRYQSYVRLYDQVKSRPQWEK